MRSKLSIITMSWYNAVTIDLIRHAVRRDTFPSRGRLWLERNCKSLPPLIRHGLRHATFPQGKALLRRTDTPTIQGKAIFHHAGGFLPKYAARTAFGRSLLFILRRFSEFP